MNIVISSGSETHPRRFTANKQRAAYLLELVSSEAMGALAYTTTPEWPKENQEAGLPDLSDLAAASARYEQQQDASMDELMRLFKAGSSPGGARPKVLINDGRDHWLAKFPFIKDTFDMVRIEAATLATARKAGIEVPQFNLKRSVERREVRACGGAGQGSLLHILVPATLAHPCTARNDAE